MSTDIFYPDTGSGSTTVDGWCGRLATAAFGTLRSGAGTHASATDSQSACCYIESTSTTDTFDALYRGAMTFDTSSIPNTVTITSAKLVITPYQLVDNFNQKVGIVYAPLGNANNVVTTDFTIIGGNNTRLATDVDVSDMVAETPVEFILNAAGIANINKEGISEFGIRFSSDIDNSITWESAKGANFNIYWSDNGSKKPYLSVTYVNYFADVSDTVTATDSFKSNIDFIISNTVSMVENVTDFFRRVWQNATKHNSTSTNSSKNSASATNEAKHNSSVTNQSKN